MFTCLEHLIGVAERNKEHLADPHHDDARDRFDRLYAPLQRRAAAILDGGGGCLYDDNDNDDGGGGGGGPRAPTPGQEWADTLARRATRRQADAAKYGVAS